MNTHQILYTKQMILAKLNGWKTVTRRTIEDEPNYIADDGTPIWRYGNTPVPPHRLKCPYGKPGDQLWTKENYEILAYSDFEQAVQVKYKADGTIRWVQLHDEDWDKYKQWKQPTGSKSKLFLFKTLSRFWDEVTGITVERVQEITREEAIAEGCGPRNMANPYAEENFKNIWQSMYKGGPYNWDNNPFVWVIRYNPLIVNGMVANQKELEL